MHQIAGPGIPATIALKHSRESPISPNPPVAPATPSPTGPVRPTPVVHLRELGEVQLKFKIRTTLEKKFSGAGVGGCDIRVLTEPLAPLPFSMHSNGLSPLEPTGDEHWIKAN